MLFSHGTAGSKGVSIVFRYNLEYQLSNMMMQMADILLHVWRYKANLIS